MNNVFKERKNRPHSLKPFRQIFQLGVFILSSITVFSVGFSSWIVAEENEKGVDVNIKADEYSPEYVNCLTSISVNPITFYKGAGFLSSDESYSNSVTVTGKVNVHIENTKSVIDTFNNNYELSLTIAFNYSENESLFSLSDYNILTDDNFVKNTTDINVSDNKANIIVSGLSEYLDNYSSTTSFPINYSFVLTFNETNLANFPDISTGLMLYFTPGEYK